MGKTVTTITEEEVMRRLREYVAQHQTRKKAAALLGVTAPYLTDVLEGNRPPRNKILQALGISFSQVYTEAMPATTARSR